jgi:Zn-dependent M16 (insulinase) family peptidase
LATTKLRIGQTVSGFEIFDLKPLEELDALGVRARHLKSGAEVFHLLNDDPENLFAFAFATPSSDSTGAAHILEHSVLCGSERHPLKDAFLVLAQGSLQTFLNAMTYPDKTIYPASSTNAADYFNLMAVYGDAVFRPRLEEWTFRQEGHRLEFGADGALERTGVVYNEMKGAYSSMDSIAGDWAFRSVLPGTPYDFDSGGDPADIPKLDWAGLRAFHARYYTGANCRIFLCGDIPTERQLAFLDERFLAELPAGRAAPPLPKAARWTEPRTRRVSYPGGQDAKTTVLVSWLAGDSTDGEETIALAALAEILLGHDGSPLARALVESRLGEDLAPDSGLQGDLRETIFTVGLRGAAADSLAGPAPDGAPAGTPTADPAGAAGLAASADAVLELILATLRRLADEGIPAAEIEAALLALEFSNREVRRAGGPYSLSWLRRSLRGWLHGAAPWETVLFRPAFSALKAKLAADPRYFEGLIRRYFLDNPHRALVIVEPVPGGAEAQAAEAKAALAARAAALSAAEKAALDAAAAELRRVQETADPPEALATIPHLARADLARTVEAVPRELVDLGGTPLVRHGLYTNGICYVELAFPVDVLDGDDYPYLPLFARTVVSLGLPGMDYAAVSSALARCVGGFHAVLQTSSAAPGAERSVATPSGVFDLVERDWLVFRLKALDSKLAEALAWAVKLIRSADFGDLRRMDDLVPELRNDLASSLAPGGHMFAAGLAGRGFSRSRAVDETWNGLSQLVFAQGAALDDTAAVAARLAAIRDRLLLKGGLVANLTADAAALEAASAALAAAVYGFGGPRPRLAARPATPGEDAAAPYAPPAAPAGGKEAAVRASASLQIGFAALALPAAPFASADQAAELVLAHRLSTGRLWEDIRMKGGAYGAFAYPDGLEPVFLLASYRDPSPARTLGAFRSALADAARGQEGEDAARAEDDLVKAIIGTYSKETRPRTGAEKGMADFMRLLYGIGDDARRRKLEAVIDMSSGALAQAAARLAGGEAVGAAVAGGQAAAEAAAALGVGVVELPV